jgi:formylglycine-generating enzyme required for sulfatase activity
MQRNGAGSTFRSQSSGESRLRDVDEAWCPQLVILPPGNFMMGSTGPERRWAMQQGAQRESVDPEKPQHRVAIAAPFAIGKYQVTRGQFATFFEATGHDMSGGAWVYIGSTWEQDASADWCSPGFEQTDQHPVVCVSWQDAHAYVAWLSKRTGQPYRLLSEAEWEYAARAGTTTSCSWGNEITAADANEAEWEYAARAGTTTSYSWGNEITAADANYDGNVGKTTEVGAYPANPWGLHDMHGNVWEWVEDCWNESYQGAPSDGSARTSGDCSRRVLRGGSWYNGPVYLRSANRSWCNAGGRGDVIGFRVARTLSRSES